MHETRVNLKHLLEDIRDSYAFPLEEVIIVELIANALDSKASEIAFFLDLNSPSLTIIDNGRGMKRAEVKDYHNIAATTKTKGRGIGFAGIGAKLSLLLADYLITETKGGYGSRCATQWYLSSETRAPWKFIPFSGKVKTSRGTAITIFLSSADSPLLSEKFVISTIKKHFSPLLYQEFEENLLRYFYPKGVKFFVNGRVIEKVSIRAQNAYPFQLRLGGRSRKLAGFGYLAKKEEELSLEHSGIAVSTFGKVIKRGWEWIGLTPQGTSQIEGLVEVPALAEILTTNKTDFLRDSSSLKKYYKYRKAIQTAIIPILEEFADQEIYLEEREKRFRSLEREIERTLLNLLFDFPELSPLVNVKKKKSAQGVMLEQDPSLVGFISQKEHQLKSGEKLSQEKEAKIKGKNSQKKEAEPKKTGPGIKIGFEENSSPDILARMIENTIWINTKHPAYLKAKKEKLQDYHIILSVGWVLSQFIGAGTSPQKFLSAFLTSWGIEERERLQFLKRGNKISK